MKAVCTALAASALCAAVFGCASVKRLGDFRGVKVEGGAEPVGVVDVYNTNWFLFSVLPIVSGDTDNPGGWTTKFFRNTATVENQLKMLEAEAKRAGASRAVNVATFTTDESVLLFLFLREKYHTMAVLIK
ncbi:MAG: hypothetical protein J6T01_02305 [Kiritimatiellae bacterium]|nr:hypothetical protein [Kiritimatiellia bacterium]